MAADQSDGGSNKQDSDDNHEIFKQGKFHLQNDFHTFLNQCAIQSLVFLMNSLRDRQTAIWLEEFTQPVLRRRTKEKNNARDLVLSDMAKAVKNATATEKSSANVEIQLLTYRGLGAINMTKFPTWESYFQQILEEPTESFKIESSVAFVPTYDLEINPASICSRLVSVREQIAREWIKDLDVIADMGGQLMDSYWEQQKSNSVEPLQRPNLLFLELSPDSTNDYMPSPLRKGNFDMLTLLATQESIHRILNNPDLQNSEMASFLRSFYTKRIGTHFTGSQWYGRADDFIEELMGMAPTAVQVQDEESSLVDPLRIVELILEERERVADEWIEEVMKVPESHMVIKRIQLNRLMGIDDSEVRNAFE